MSSPALDVLLVEDDPADVVLFREALAEEESSGRPFVIADVADLGSAITHIGAESFDVIVLDLSLPDSRGLETFDAVAQAAHSVPIVVHSGLDDPQLAVRAVRGGAQDYLVKGRDQPSALASALGGAIARQRTECELAHLANHHPLTGLPRRQILERRVAAALVQSDRTGDSLPLIHLELDGLDDIARTHGEAAADTMRKAAGERLAAGLDAADTIGHPDDDGFAVVVESVAQPSEAASLAGRLLDAVARPFTVGNLPLVTAGRVGIGVLPADGRRAAEALGNVRAAARRAVPGSFVFCDAEMTELMHRRHALQADMPDAIRGGELVLHFQPLVSPETGEVGSVEALLRWNHPVLGLIAPGEFIPLAEESGLIVDVGEWVLRAACWQLRAWDRAGLPHIGMAVNVSPRQFAAPRLIPTVQEALGASGIAPDRLELEVTESTLADPELTTNTLGQLRRLGVKMAIDDFGTGFSSLAYLRRFPIDTLKIDRSFVSDLGEDAHAAEIVTAILGLARQQALGTVAEGVETEDQAGFLREQGCDRLQGFGVCRPLPVDEASEWLGAHAVAVAG